VDLEDAIIFAADAHRGRVDKAGRPYIWHPLRVALALDDAREQMAAVLHDVVEDTAVTLEQLRFEGLAEEIADAIHALTRPVTEDYAAFIERLAANPIARAVKIADIRDNLDPKRLALLLADERMRLQAKYEPALRRLTAG
jgi:(p)ppGpp synthase/HD superfamily hydrolase